MMQKLQEALPRADRPRWDESLAPLGWQALAFAGGALAAGGSLLGRMHPFGLALVLGVQTSMALSAGAGAAVGSLLLLDPASSLRYLAALAAALAGRWLGRHRFWPAAAAGCGSLWLVQLLLSLAGLATLPEALSALGEGAAAVLFGLALRQRQAGQRGVQLASLAALMMAGACLQRFGAGAFQPGLLLFGSVCLALARRGHVREVAVLCVAMSTALLCAAPELASGTIGISAGCLLAAAFAPGERLAGSVLFSSGCLPGILAAPTPQMALRFLVSAVGIQLGAWLVPRSALAAVEGNLPPEASQKPTLAGAAGRLDAVSEALEDIAQTVNQVCQKLPPRGESYNWVVERVVRELCRGCARCQECWVQEYGTTVDGFFALKPFLEQQGRVGVEQLPGQLCRCIHPAELCGACGRSWVGYQGRRQAGSQADVLRSAVTEQYSALAGALEQLARDLGRDTRLDAARSGRVADYFAGIGLEPLETAVTLDTLDRMEARVTVNRTTFTDQECRTLAQEVGRICRRTFAPPAVYPCRTVTSLIFAEQPVYCPVFGAASLPAKLGDPCGDAVEHFCDSFGGAHLLLCDGMGTGQAAAVDGALAASLTGKLLRAGFDAAAAARLVNVALSLKGAEESQATLDLASADLYTGRVRLYKAGAVTSFLVRQGAVRPLRGSSLPVGILARVVGRCQQVDLAAGDWLVLLSDGVLADGETWVIQQLQLCAQTRCSPQECCRMLVEAARQRTGETQRPDDVTAAILMLERGEA